MIAHHQAQPLLAAAEEIALARRVKAGGADGLEARNELVERNKGLVVNIARPRVTRSAPMADLIQEGMLGLVTAADRFDPDRHGTRFSTFAKYWVFRSIILARRAGRLVRLPSATWELLRRDPAQLTRGQRSCVASALTTDAVGSMEGAELQVAAPDDGPPDLDGPETARVLAAMDRLPPRHRDVLRRRLAGETLVAIGLSLGVTKEWVRQLEAEALHLMRRDLGVPSVDPRRVRSAERRRIYEIERTRRPAARLKGGT